MKSKNCSTVASASNETVGTPLDSVAALSTMLKRVGDLHLHEQAFRYFPQATDNTSVGRREPQFRSNGRER